MVKKIATELLVEKGPTWMKQQPNADADSLPQSEKFSLQEGESIQIKSYDDEEIQGHYKIELGSPVNGLVFWYTYKDHVRIIE